MIHARLIAVTVVPDRTPVVRIERPARDLLLPDARSSVEVTGSVADDIAIRALTLRYTKVSGSGEQIDFVEGELPLQIARESEQQWRARGAIALPRLGLEPGDSLVYRLVAQDGRTGDAGMAASDTYFVEIAGPGQVPLEGVEMPPEQERYALSQQMIVVKIKRLRERERALPARGPRRADRRHRRRTAIGAGELRVPDGRPRRGRRGRGGAVARDPGRPPRKQLEAGHLARRRRT